MSIQVMLAGESWISTSSHVKGWDAFGSADYVTGIEYLQRAFDAAGDIRLRHMPAHAVPSDFPGSVEALGDVDVLILSDVGANTLLLHPDTWVRGKTSPNRLSVIRDWTEAGGALVMCGGYFSFAGINAAAKFYRTAIEEVLPVQMHTFDDRVETPQGGAIECKSAKHPIMQGVQLDAPLLGYNEVVAKDGAEVLVSIENDPLVAIGEYGKGRTLVWTSDIGPHWCPEECALSEGFVKFWQQAVRWLVAK